MKIKYKLLLLSLMSILGATGCGNKEELTYEESQYEETIDNNDTLESALENIEVSLEEPTKEQIVELSEEELTVTNEEPLFTTYKTITATTNVNIRDEDVEGNIIGVLPEGKSLRLLYTLENNWYEVDYYGKFGYVSGEYVIETSQTDINRTIKKVYYATEDISITIPPYLSANNVEETVIIPKLECLEVYDQIDDTYLVKTNEYIGYTNTTSLEELSGTFVVVDISSQELKLYCDNEIVLTTPVVTGKPKTPSDKGLFEIYDISSTRYLIGPNYKTYVDIMMKYNGGEGLHDAEYHTHEDGFKHGWRNASEFGGETYLSDGSHGCINMLHEDVTTVKEQVDIGTKVLVKH